jgi:hypothetical protein
MPQAFGMVPNLVILTRGPSPIPILKEIQNISEVLDTNFWNRYSERSQ